MTLPDYRGRVIIGAGTGVGLSPRALGAVGGEEGHVLAIAELAVHHHWMFNDNNYGATSWGLGIGSGDGRSTAVRSNSGVGGGDEKYHMNVANAEADRLRTGREGSGAAHNTMQPFAVASVGIKY
jgi:microcystin-dependent protein